MITTNRLKEIQAYVTHMLKRVKDDKKLREAEGLDDAPINWNDIACDDAICCRNVDDDVWVWVRVSEASPDCLVLHSYLFDCLSEMFLDIQFEISSEW